MRVPEDVQREYLMRRGPVIKCPTLSHFSSYRNEPEVCLACLGFHWNVLKADGVRMQSGQHMVALSLQAKPQVLTAWCCFLCQHPTECLCRCLHLTREHYSGPIHKIKRAPYCMWQRFLATIKMWAFLPLLSFWRGCPTRALFPKLIVHLEASYN